MSEQAELFNDAPVAVAGKPAKAKKDSDPLAGKTIRIVLEESDDIPPNGLFIGHNGRGYLLKPGLEADVPLPLVEILDHAVISAPVVDPITRQVTGYRDRLKYNYRTVSR